MDKLENFNNMKQIFIFAFFFGIFSSCATAQKNKIQEEVEVKRVVLWDKPTTDSITYNGIIPDTTKIVVMFTGDGKAVYVLTPKTQYDLMQTRFDDSTYLSNAKSAIIGFEYLAAYVGNFSWLTSKQLKKLTAAQKDVAQAFNEKTKYTLMAQNPRTIAGTRDLSGNIIPSYNTMENSPASQKKLQSKTSKP